MSNGNFERGTNDKGVKDRGTSQKPHRITQKMVRGGASTPTDVSERVERIYRFTANLRKAGHQMREWHADRDSGLAAASSVLRVAESTMAVVEEYENWVGTITSLPSEQAAERISQAADALQALDLIAKLADKGKSRQFMKNPTARNAQAWAVEAARSFSDAAAFVPDGYTVVGPYLSGLLGAPMHYVTAVTGTLFEYLDARDVDFSEDDWTLRIPGESDNAKGTWTGPLARIYGNARSTGYLRGLADLMDDHKDRLEEFNSLRVGAAEVMILVAEEGDAYRRRDWLRFLAPFLN